jgi:hypothetical protein
MSPERPAAGRPLSVSPILTRSLRYGAIWAVAVAVVAGLIGLLVAGVPGLVGGLVGAIMAGVFLALTALSMLLGGRLARGDGTSPVFFGTVLAALILKLIVFLVVVLLLRTQPWMSSGVFAFAAIAAVLGSLVADLLAFARSRVPYVSDVTLPGETTSGDAGDRRDGRA